MPVRSWIQCPNTGKLIPREEYVRPKGPSHAVHGDIQAFVSPIDGEVISDRKQYREHCKKHNVVNTAEFDGAWSEAAKKRADYYEGRRSKEDSFRRKQQINEIINYHERNAR